ncbi:uncharacterized protein BJX67DRAFT_276286 [Aspergillus lucknowensis]|uniref:Letm1 RBD domain-containing protein n=1 Tax=Aspergillus lucknowensis TaxID=176173 RepID=A0ABR4LHT9_9EURO
MASICIQRARLSQFHPQLPYLILPPRLNHSHNHFNLHLHLRYASSKGKSHARPPSSAQPAEKRVPSTSSTATTTLADDINPPPSTRPADLVVPESLPPSAPAADKLKYYIAVGRAYVSFYKTGLKNVYHNYRASLPIRRSLGIPSYLPTSPPPNLFYAKSKSKSPKSDSNSKSTEKALLEATRTTRSTFQLLHRAAHDVRRMIPFTLILIICGELSPFVLLALGSAVTPYTCRFPRQLEKYRRQGIVRKRAALSAHSAAASGSITHPGFGSDEEMQVLARFVRRDWIARASGEEILRACAALGLAKTHVRPGWMGGLLYRRRLKAYAEYLALDDELMRKGGGVSALEGAEITVAVEERGGYGVADGEEGWEAERVRRRWLEKWLSRSK